MAKNSSGLHLILAGVLVLCTSITATPGHAAVGRTAGSFNVSNSGSAHYAIPIFTPPGPRGIQPSVALVYNSNGGVGYIGKGWSLAGFSAITHCNKTIAQDGVAGLSGYLEGIFCLDGNRLRLQSGSLEPTGEWATEIADFSRITSHWEGFPQYWTVKRKDGLTYTYGGTLDSVNGAYLIQEISDRNGNKVKFTYADPYTYTVGTTHPIKIEWTRTSSTGSSFVYSMEFIYESNGNAAASSPIGAANGSAVHDTDLLESILIKSSGTTVRKYLLDYDPSPTTGGKRLATVTECDGASTPDCLSPTEITYQDGQVGVASSPSFTLSAGNGQSANGNFDYNGDGLKDLTYWRSAYWYVRFATGGGNYGGEVATGNNEMLLMAGDPFGNGRDVLMGLNGGSTWHAFMWTGSGFSPVSTGLTLANSSGEVSLSDVDGDGRDDLLYMINGGGTWWGWPNGYGVLISMRPSQSTGSTPSFGASVDNYAGFQPPAPSDVWEVGEGGDGNEYFGYWDNVWAWLRIAGQDPWVKRGLDADGDGRQDIIADASFYAVIWPSSGGECMNFPAGCYPGAEGPQPYSTVLASSYGEILYSQTDIFRPVRLNSDGCTDQVSGNIVAFSHCAVGSAFGSADSIIRGMVDWDGDGRQDVLVRIGTDSTLSVQRSTGNGLAAAVATNLPHDCSFFITDADGDGLDDVGCEFYNGGSHIISVYLHNGATVHPDLAVSFKDGFGVEYEVSYALSTDEVSEPEVYTPNTNPATYPQKDFTAPQVLVRTATFPDGIGETYTTTYSYFGATLDMEGRGWQGFEEIESVDSRTSIKNLRIFEKEFPKTGMLLQDNLYQSDSTPIRLQTNTLAVETLSTTAYNQRYFPKVTSSTSDTYEVGGTKNGDWVTRTSVTNTFDTSGNLTASTSTVTDKDGDSDLLDKSWTVATTVSFSTSSDRTTYWCLGLPDSVSVASSTTVPDELSVTRERHFSPDYENCRMDAEIVEPSSSTLRVDTEYDYDEFGNVSMVTVTGRNPDTSEMTERISETIWGSADGTPGGTGQFPVLLTDPLDHETERTFHPTFGSLVTDKDPNNIVVAQNEYDTFGRLTRTLRSDGTGTRMTYADCATIGCLSVNPATGVTGINKAIVTTSERDTSDDQIRSTLTYTDEFDRPIFQRTQMLSGGFSAAFRQYDEFGRVSRESAPCDFSSCTVYWTDNSYDLLGRLTLQTRQRSEGDPSAVTTTFSYAGRTHTITDPNGKLTTKVQDVYGRMRSSRDDDNYGQNFQYDAAGGLTKVTDTLSNDLFTAIYSYGIKPFQTSTDDMDLGEWSYTYNSLGELLEWEDANGKLFSQAYDALSRVTSRIAEDEDTTFTWGDGTTTGAYSIGRLASVSMTDSASATDYSEALTFDNKGRVITRSITADNDTYDFDLDYNNQGQLNTLTYPTSTSSTRVKVKYHYQFGHLYAVQDFTSGSGTVVYWAANSQNAHGQVTQETRGAGAGVVVNRSFDAVTGWLSFIKAGVGGLPGAGGGTELQNQSYLYDKVGNVTQRQENTLGVSENFCYDDLYRLLKTELASSSSPSCASPDVTIGYDPMGNITHRSDVNSDEAWEYEDPNGKNHAVTSTGDGGMVFAYDDNGNMISRAGEAIEWTTYNYPWKIETATESTTFKYGPDRQYYMQDYSGPGGSEITYYIGGLLEKVTKNSVEDWRHYIKVNGQTVAINTRKSDNTSGYKFALEDNQGSASNLTDWEGTSLVRESFNAFGKPRDGNDWDEVVPSGDQTIIEGISRRGYTSHSMLGRMGLIHMNGRVQDATIGRFLSPDPYVTQPGFTQGYNRFAYVNNNPLSYIDPSGFWCVKLFGASAGTTCDTELAEVQVQNCHADMFMLNLGFGRFHCVDNNFLQNLFDSMFSRSGTDVTNLELPGTGGGGGTGTQNSKEKRKLQEMRPPRAPHDPCNGTYVSSASERLKQGPDYISIGIPVDPRLPFLGISVTLDRYWQLYIGPAIGVGYPSAGFAAGLLADKTAPQEDGDIYRSGTIWTRVPSATELREFLSGFSGGMGAGLGASVNLSSDEASANTAVLLTTPGVGFSYSFDTGLGLCKR